MPIGEYYITCSGPLPCAGTWSAPASPFASQPAGGSPYNGQSTEIVKIPGKVDGYVYVADHWIAPVRGSPAILLPITFPTATTMLINQTSWDLSFFASAGPAPSSVITGTASIRGGSIR